MKTLNFLLLLAFMASCEYVPMLLTEAERLSEDVEITVKYKDNEND